uniref:Uncharacterized protein n=1 Tax=Oryza glumipatula TaxID=40148 RepID=A0A0E0AS07_9ORYZ
MLTRDVDVTKVVTMPSYITEWQLSSENNSYSGLSPMSSASREMCLLKVATELIYVADQTREHQTHHQNLLTIYH